VHLWPRRATGDNVTDILALIIKIAQAQSIEAAWALGTGYFAGLGFSRVNYGFTRFRHDKTIGDPDDALFLTTLDDDYAQRYFHKGFYARTPVFRWAERNVGACTWAWVREALEQGRLTPAEIDAVRQNAAMGIVAGISVSFPPATSRTKGALGLIADKGLDHADVDRIFAQHHDALLAVAHCLNMKIMLLPQATHRRTLTQRQRETLEWVADGKTMQDVALLMGVSPAMVEKHLRLAREALDVETTAQAVAKGAMLNMLFLPEPSKADS
jgi:DNA-binding CsgD family transcriptional regulator